MVANKIIVNANDLGTYTLSNVNVADIAKVDIVDVDLLILTKSGQEIILPNAGLEAMGSKPTQVALQDGNVALSALLQRVSSTIVSIDSNHIITSIEPTLPITPAEKEEIKEAVEKAIKETKEAMEEEQKKHDSESSSQTSSLTVNTESSVEQMVEEAQKIVENLKTSDYDYVPPYEFKEPPGASVSPPGVPAPISLTPVVTLFMGNVVGSTYDTTTSPGTTIIYGGGGAVGSESTDQIGPRNALQFSAATITGTSGNDLIYAQGPDLGNPAPSVSTSNYAKEFVLNVAGYFITLNDVEFSGVPAGITIEGATDNGGGSWTLPADYAIKQNVFKIIYDSASTGSFDIVVDITGQTTRAAEFHSQQNFRFQYMDVTDVSQVTDQSLTYEYQGRLNSIYILPTQDQPNTIALDAGIDTVYGGRNSDTITGGDGDKTVFAREGDDNITLGDGDNTVDLGDGDNVLVSGDGINNVTGGTGFNTITVGSANDVITLTSGGGVIAAGDGENSVTVGAGDYTITTGSDDDVIVSGAGNSTINAGDGENSVTVGAGTNSVTTGAGDDTIIGGSGNDTFLAGLGTNVITGGGGTDTLDYSNISSTAITASFVSLTTTGTGLSDSFSGITRLVATSLNDAITGSSANQIIEGGAGNDTITGGGGDDLIYGGEGDDILTGNTGNDTIYGGGGSNTISGGTSGTDYLYGGTGNDTFISPHSGTFYYGTDSTALAVGELNTINYSSATTGLNINLLSGLGSGGLADGSFYAFTSTLGYNSINGITGGSGSDNITGSKSDDTINGGTGNDTLTGGEGTNILIGGGGGGTDYYWGGLGNDTFTGNTSTHDIIYYRNSSAGIVVNFSNSTQAYINSLGVTRSVAAYSGSNWGVTASDANSHSNGDTFTAVSGTSTSINEVNGTSYNDLIFGGSDYLAYYNTYGGIDIAYAGTGGMSFLGYDQKDYFYGGSGGDSYYYSGGLDVADGGTGFNVIRTYSFYRGDYNVVVYLDATADTNSNGISDYIDRSVSSLVSEGVTYTGFEYGWNNASSGSAATLIKNFDNIVGNSANEYFVGNNNANQINARGGANTIFGLGGNDIITISEGQNSVDGGIGTDIVNFQYTNTAVSGSLAASSPNYTYGVNVFLADGTFLGVSDKSSYWGDGYSIFQSRTGTTGSYSYSTITNVENINGSDYNDVIYGNSSANTIYGNGGDDVIAGGGGADSLYAGSGNDTFRVLSSDLASVAVFDGSTGTDILYSSGWTFAANSIANAKYVAIETVDVRDSVSGGSYGLSATDIQYFADNGSSSTVNLKLDTGDVFTATGYTSLSGSGSDYTYRYYSDVGLTTQIAVLNIHYGVG